MKSYVNLWKYIDEFVLEWDMFQTKVVEKIKTQFYVQHFFSKIGGCLWENVEKYDAGRQAIQGKKTRRTKDGICKPDNYSKNTDTHL